MRWPRFAVLVLAAALLQAGYLDGMAVSRLNVTPNLLVILMVFFAIRSQITEAVVSSFAIGLAADIISMGFPMGPQVISFGLFGTGLAYLHRVIAIRKLPQEAIAIFVVCFLTGALAKLLGAAAGQAVRPGMVQVLAGTSLYSAVVGPFVFLLLGWVMRTRGRAPAGTWRFPSRKKRKPA